VSGNERPAAAHGVRERLGLRNVHPWVFLAHGIVALGAFGLGVIGLLGGHGLQAVPMLGIGVLILVLGKYAGRIAARR
jgi:hypothetical protein